MGSSHSKCVVRPSAEARCSYKRRLQIRSQEVPGVPPPPPLDRVYDSTQHLHLAAPGGRRGQARPPPLPPPGHGSDGAKCCPPDPANGGVRRFQHLIMQTLPRSVCNFFLQRRDEAIRVTLERILHLAPDTLRRQAETRARMPHLLGGRQCAKGSAPSAMQPLWQPMPSPAVNHLSKSGYREESIYSPAVTARR